MLHRWTIGAAAIQIVACLLVGVVLAPASLAQSDVKEKLRFAHKMATGGSWREAQYRWEQVLAGQPDNAKVLNNLGVAAEALGRFDDAAGFYQQALELLPNNHFVQDNYRRHALFARELRQRQQKPESDDARDEMPRLSLASGGKKEGKVERVPVRLPIPPRLVLEDQETLLIASFLDEETRLLDINRELVRFLRSEFRRNTPLEVLDIVPPPAIPEQTPADLLANREFWKHLHREYGADLIVSGVLTYDRDDISGFHDVDIVSPTTGQKVRSSQFLEQERFHYYLEVFFIDGPSGELLFRDRMEQSAIFRGLSNDPIGAFYEMSDAIAADVLAVVTTRIRLDTRTIFKK